MLVELDLELLGEFLAGPAVGGIGCHDGFECLQAGANIRVEVLAVEVLAESGVKTSLPFRVKTSHRGRVPSRWPWRRGVQPYQPTEVLLDPGR